MYWNSERSSSHFNIFFRLSEVRYVRFLTDNSTVVAYIFRQGETRSSRLCREAYHLRTWCICHGFDLLAVHLPDVDNVLANSLSRQRLCLSD